MMKSSSEHLLRLDVVSRTPPERKSSVHLPMGAQCAICLFVITDRALLESCAHEFCRVCLLEWSKLSRDCPLCRRQFNCVQTNSGKLPIPAILPLTSTNSANNTESISGSNEVDDSEQSDDDDDDDDDDQQQQQQLAEQEEGDALQNSQLVQQLNRQFEQGDLNVDCDQLNSLINQLFGHVQLEEGELQWPF